jgi:hypothetical protein
MNRDGLIEHRPKTGTITTYSRITFDTASLNDSAKRDEDKDGRSGGCIGSEMRGTHEKNEMPTVVLVSPVTRCLLDPPLSRTIDSADSSYARFANIAQPASHISSSILESPSRAIENSSKSGWNLVLSSLSESLKSINIFSGYFNELKRSVPINFERNREVIHADHLQ